MGYYWPDGTNTGVPDGVILDPRTGDIHVTQAGTVLSGLDIRGTVYIEAANVTIQNCKITSSSYWSIYIRQGITGATVKDSEIDGQGRTGKGILGQGTFLRNDIKGVVDGIDIMGDNSLIEGNYIHDLFGTASPHYDGINIDASNVTVRHNTVINDHTQTSALMVSSDWGTDTNVLVEDNLLVGGGYTIYAVTGDAGPGSLVDVRFVNNHFGGGYYGLTRLNTSDVIMTGNLSDGLQLAALLDENGPNQVRPPTVPTVPTTTLPTPTAPTNSTTPTGTAEDADGVFFSKTGYLSANADVAAASMDPLQHYHNFGWREGRDPAVSFDTGLYLLRNPDVAAAGVDPLVHFLEFGKGEGRVSSPAIGATTAAGFDFELYLLDNPDVGLERVDALTHYNTFGWHEGRNPNAYFDTAGYLTHNPDVAAAGVNPLQHYDQYGWKEGRDPSGAFDTVGYLAAYPDVAVAQMDPLQHFLTYGVYEGRSSFGDGMFG